MSGLSNWREEFNLSEVVTGKMTDKEALKKVSEKSNINNKVTINPKLDEAVKEIGGEVIGMVEQDTTAQKQRIDMKQMILDRQKLKLRRKDLSAAKKEKKEGEEGESTNAMKQANVIAQEEVVDIKKENEKKRKNALQIQKVIGEGDWIQKATKNMRKDKPCTGEKFGSESCPPGSKRYNLAKTFRKMAKEETEVNEGVMKMVKKVMSKKKPEKKKATMDAITSKVHDWRKRNSDKQKEHEKYVNFLPVDEGKGYQPEIEHSKLGDAKKKADKKRESKLPPHLQGDAIGKMRKAFASEDKAFDFVKNKLKAKYGDGVLTKGDKMPEPSAAQKKKNAEIRAKRAKEDHRDPTEKASDGRYSDRYSNRGSD